MDALAPAQFKAGDRVRAARAIFYRVDEDRPGFALEPFSGLVQVAARTSFGIEIAAAALGRIVAVLGDAKMARVVWIDADVPASRVPIETMLRDLELAPESADAPMAVRVGTLEQRAVAALERMADAMDRQSAMLEKLVARGPLAPLDPTKCNRQLVSGICGKPAGHGGPCERAATRAPFSNPV